MLVSPIEGHRLWAPSYDARPNPLLSLETRMLSGLLDSVASLRVIDVACGTGRWMDRLSRLRAQVFGIDACAQMIAEAARKPNLRGALLLADAGALPFGPETADITLCSFAIGYIADLTGALAEMARITKRSGAVVISDLHPSAAAAGWTRSFRSGNTVYRIEHFNRSSGRLCREARRAGLELELQAEGFFGEPERAAFLAAGKADIFAELSRVPAVWVGIWKRP
jgi:malonyl-CoA O-methyltransferase